MSERRKLGEQLKLSLQLGDGATQTASVRVFVELKDAGKVLLEPRFELTDDADGLYTDDDVKVMPTNSAIKATYFITDSGGTDLTTLFAPAVVTEEYLRDFTGELVEDGISGSTGSGQDNIEGVASADEALIAEIAEESLIGELSDDTILEGEVRDEC